MNRHGSPWLTFVLFALLGCDAAAPRGDREHALNHSNTIFSAASAGTIRGRVVWRGPVPDVAPFAVYVNLLGNDMFQTYHTRPNPNAPILDAGSNGVRDVVVFLRGVDPANARPWDHAPVTVEQRDCRFVIRQGDVESRIGFVRRGAAVRMISRDDVYHSLHARGAAFFSLPFPDRDSPLERVLPENGVVELTSGAHYFWMRAYLLVAEHPYFTRTDAAGCFTLSGVPPGTYEVVCWMPSWVKERHERDPESGFVTRVFFRPPREQARAVEVAAGEVKEVLFTLRDEEESR